MRISYSALDTFKKCPQKYKFAVIEKRKAPKSKEAIFGTAVHESIKFMFSRDPLFPTIEEVLAHFRNAIVATPHLSEDEKTRYRASGEKMIINFYKKNPPWNFNIIDLESRFEVALDDPKTGRNHVLVGKIDRIDKGDDEVYEIIDYKTASKLPSQEKVNENLQLSLYQLGIHKRWPHLSPENVKLSLYFLKAGEKLTTQRNSEELRGTEEKLLGDLREIEKKTNDDDFPPFPSPLCNWCGYKPICPAWKHLYDRKNQALTEKIEVESLVTKYTTLKEEIRERTVELKKISDAIHDYLNETGLERLFGDTAIIARKIQERSTYDIEKLRDVLEKEGLWHEVLAPDVKRLKKLLPTLSADLQEKIKEAVLVKRFAVLALSKKPIDLHESPEDLA